MRLRNIPRAHEVLFAHEKVVKNPKDYKGKWKKQVFGNDAPVFVEIGMGKGQFLLTLAGQNPDMNYIGIERYSSVLLRAVEGYDEEGVVCPNLRFLCMDATELLEVFAPGEVSRIYLNFSDPWPKKRHERRRLTSTDFFERYESVLAEGGTVEFKTDNRELFAFSLGQVKESGWRLLAYTFDLHREQDLNKDNVMTEYEERFSALGNPICKLIAVRTCKDTKNRHSIVWKK